MFFKIWIFNFCLCCIIVKSRIRIVDGCHKKQISKITTASTQSNNEFKLISHTLGYFLANFGLFLDSNGLPQLDTLILHWTITYFYIQSF